MNTIQLQESLNGNPKWTKFAQGLYKSMMEEFNLDGVTVVLRELSPEERANEEKEVLVFFHERQAFEFAMDSTDRFPAPWKVADRIEHFLNPIPEDE